MDGVNRVQYDEKTRIWSSTDPAHIFNPEAGLGPIILFCLEKTPNKVTQINADDGSVMTCAEMRTKSIRVAVNLTKMGLKQGDVVSIASKNVPHLAPLVFGCWIIGVALNPVDFVMNKNDSFRMIKMAEPKLIVCDQENFEIAKKADFEQKILNFNDQSIEELLSEVENEENFQPPNLVDPIYCLAAILCSSGTTGACKGVKLPHGLLVIQGLQFFSTTEDDVTMNFASFYWITAIYTLLYSTSNGAKRLITTQKASPEVIERLINEFKVTQIIMNNHYTSVLVKYLRETGKNLPTMKNYGLGGAAVSKKLENSIQEFIPNGYVCSDYGITEVAGIISVNFKRKFKDRGLGFLKNQIKAKIINENGENLGPGEIGEICLKGKYPFMGYLTNDEATRKALDSEGWFHTGDMGYFDEDNYLMFYERKKDVIDIEGQAYVSPSELESLIVRIPGVVSVCVVGLFDESGYGRPAAVVVKTKDSPLTAKEVQDYVKARVDPKKDLSGGVYFVDQMPLTATGKIMRRKVKEIAEILREECKGIIQK